LEASDPRNLKSRGDYHINAKTFKDKVNQAIQGAFPKSDNFRYKAVHVLLLSWEEDDLDPPCSAEIKRLRRVFNERYRFAVEEWKIPSGRRSHGLCGDTLNAFVTSHEHQDVLLIIYYAGHGTLDRDRQCIWYW
jgi:Caspase domain